MTYEKCPSCGTDLGDGRCRACDAENDRLNPPETPEPRMAAIRAEIAETAGAIEATEERTPMPDADVRNVLAYLYAEAGVRARMLGATDAERLAHAAVRQDIRELAERFGVELEG
jgi:hypothetical protein